MNQLQLRQKLELLSSMLLSDVLIKLVGNEGAYHEAAATLSLGVSNIPFKNKCMYLKNTTEQESPVHFYTHYMEKSGCCRTVPENSCLTMY